MDRTTDYCNRFHCRSDNWPDYTRWRHSVLSLSVALIWTPRNPLSFIKNYALQIKCTLRIMYMIASCLAGTQSQMSPLKMVNMLWNLRRSVVRFFHFFLFFHFFRSFVPSFHRSMHIVIDDSWASTIVPNSSRTLSRLCHSDRVFQIDLKSSK